MSVCPTKAKGTHSCTSGNSLRYCPVLDLGVHIKWGSFESKMLVVLLKMQRRHQFFLLHGQQDFLQTSYASRSRGMTNITFDRADGTILSALRLLLKNSR